jgi:hypothetical protein
MMERPAQQVVERLGAWTGEIWVALIDTIAAITVGATP